MDHIVIKFVGVIYKCNRSPVFDAQCMDLVSTNTVHMTEMQTNRSCQHSVQLTSAPASVHSSATLHNSYIMLLMAASSGVARICCEEGQSCKLCHGALTVDIRAGRSNCSMTKCFMTNAVLIERAVNC